jgi:hypothetical protein
MPVRETINRHPVLVIAAIAIAVGIVIWQTGWSSGTTRGTGKATATVDDGATWFYHDYDWVPPFSHEGKTAYGALLYEAKGKTFVGLMTRYKPESKKTVERALAERRKGHFSTELEGDAQMARDSGLEIKKPGEAKWVSWPTGTAGGRPLPPVVSAAGDAAEPVTP